MYDPVQYGCGYITGYQFREPELLNHFLRTGVLPVNPGNKNIWGWLVHFLFGFIFAFLIGVGWNYFYFINEILFAVITGVIAGVLGVAGWHILFHMTSDPPKIQLRKFYFQLIGAHIIFSFSLLYFLK